jgi:hypothetical protein
METGSILSTIIFFSWSVTLYVFHMDTIEEQTCRAQQAKLFLLITAVIDLFLGMLLLIFMISSCGFILTRREYAYYYCTIFTLVFRVTGTIASIVLSVFVALYLWNYRCVSKILISDIFKAMGGTKVL